MLLLSISITACAQDVMWLPSALPEPKRVSAINAAPAAETRAAEHTRIETIVPLSASNPQQQTSQGLPLPAGKLSLNADAMPLNRFIHLALVDVLKLSVDVDAAVANRTDPVTLHVSQPVSAERLLGMVEDSLSLFDVGLSRSGDVIRVLPVSKMDEAPPSIVSDRARMLVHMGRVIEFIQMRYAPPGEVMAIVRHFLGNSVAGNIITYSRFNAVLVIGKAASIARLRKAISMIDRPSLKGRFIRTIYPVYWQAKELSGVLEKMLGAQGIPMAQPAIRGGVKLIPVEEINAIIVVSPEKEWLGRLLAMVENLDKPKATGAGNKRFVYFVKNARAQDLGAVIMQVLSGKSGSVGREDKGSTASEQGDKGLIQRGGKFSSSGSVQSADVAGTGKLAVITDQLRNVLIFVGSAEAYRNILPLLKTLDRPPRQVLLEATIVEVKLDDTTQFGVEAAVNNVDNSRSMTGLLSTIGGLGVGGGGLTYTLINAAADVRIKINALATEGKAKVLASPTLLAMDNETAHMQIGDQIAVLSQEVGDARANNGGSAGSSTGILRSFNYVDTGVILDVTPTINEGGVVRMKLHQEVSRPGASANNTPPISKRSVDTTLVAKSGQTVLIGGLISHTETTSRTKVPFLGDIPILGHLFSNDSIIKNNTELIVLITPHIINGSNDADFLRKAFQDKLGWQDLAVNITAKKTAAEKTAAEKTAAEKTATEKTAAGKMK